MWGVLADAGRSLTAARQESLATAGLRQIVVLATGKNADSWLTVRSFLGS
jgi:hypothetical protein